MPSFPVNNGNYFYYLQLSGSSISQISNVSSLSLLFIFTIIMILGCVFFTCIGFIFKYIALHHHDWYFDQHQIYYYDDIWRVLVQSSMSGLFIYIICIIGLIDKYYYHQTQNTSKLLLKWIIFIWFILNIIITCTITLILSYYHHQKHLNETYVFPEKGYICNHIFKCWSNTPFMLTLNTLFPMFMPLITFFFVHIFIIYYQNKCTQHNISVSPIKTPLIAINDTMDIFDDEDDSEITKIRASTINEITSYKDWLWVYLFFIMWGCLCLFISINYSIKSDVLRNYWEIYYLYLMSTTSIIKFCLKQIGRKIDGIRLSDQVSIEYFMEFVGSTCYWILYRVAISYHTPSPQLFALTILIHILSEVFQCSIRINNQYYEWSNIFINKFNKKCIIYRIFYDKCTKQEWRIRIAMDIIVRIYVSIITGILTQLYNVSVPDRYFDDHQRTHIYNAIATSAELIYFIIVVQIFYNYYNIHMLRLYSYYIDNIGHTKLILSQYFTVFAFISLLG